MGSRLYRLTENRRQYIIRVTNPADGSEMGIISTPGAGSDGNDGDDLSVSRPKESLTRVTER